MVFRVVEAILQTRIFEGVFFVKNTQGKFCHDGSVATLKMK